MLSAPPARIGKKARPSLRRLTTDDYYHLPIETPEPDFERDMLTGQNAHGAPKAPAPKPAASAQAAAPAEQSAGRRR